VGSRNRTTVAPCDRPNLRANGETDTRRAVMREASHVVTALGLSLSPGAIRVLVDTYLDGDQAGRAYGFAAWFLGYSDPTGDAAVRNVMGANQP